MELTEAQKRDLVNAFQNFLIAVNAITQPAQYAVQLQEDIVKNINHSRFYVDGTLDCVCEYIVTEADSAIDNYAYGIKAEELRPGYIEAEGEPYDIDDE